MKKIGHFFIFFLFLTFSCLQNESERLKPEIGNSETIVTLDEAEALALKGAKASVPSSGGRTADNVSIKESKTYNDDGNVPLFHVIKFNDGKGFRVISADRQFAPLLAHSDNGDLNEQLPGVSHWLEFVSGYLKNERSNDMLIDEKKQAALSSQWQTFEAVGFPFFKDRFTTATGRTKIQEPDPNQCAPGYHWYVASLTSTSWGQGAPFNYSFSVNDCASTCYKSPAGCGAIAMAQIMRRHQKPDGYGYTSMPNGYTTSCGSYNYGQLEAARLVVNTASAVNSFQVTVSIPFYCTVSTATKPWGIPQGFSQMGYSSGGNYGDFFASYSTIFNNILGGYPAIMSGKKGFLGLSSWHIWIIDGVDRYVTPDCQVYEWFRCNWGWSGSGNNDWYWYGNGSYNGYDTDLKAVTNIIP